MGDELQTQINLLIQVIELQAKVALLERMIDDGEADLKVLLYHIRNLGDVG